MTFEHKLQHEHWMCAELTAGALKKLKMKKKKSRHSPKKAPLKICKFIRSRTSEVGAAHFHHLKVPRDPMAPSCAPRKPHCCHLLQPPCCLLPQCWLTQPPLTQPTPSPPRECFRRGWAAAGAVGQKGFPWENLLALSTPGCWGCTGKHGKQRGWANKTTAVPSTPQQLSPAELWRCLIASLPGGCWQELPTDTLGGWQARMGAQQTAPWSWGLIKRKAKNSVYNPRTHLYVLAGVWNVLVHWCVQTSLEDAHLFLLFLPKPVYLS